MRKYKKINVDQIILSGWDNYENEYSLNNYYISIIKETIKGKKLKLSQKKKVLINKLYIKKLLLKKIHLNKDKKIFLLVV